MTFRALTLSSAHTPDAACAKGVDVYIFAYVITCFIACFVCFLYLIVWGVLRFSGILRKNPPRRLDVPATRTGTPAMSRS